MMGSIESCVGVLKDCLPKLGDGVCNLIFINYLHVFLPTSLSV